MGNTTIPTQSYRAMESGQSKSYIIPFALLCSLFFLWAVANNLNDILLPQFQQAFTLTNFQAGLIQSAFYFGYFIIPIPAGMLMKKFSYKAGILTGLFLYACGAALFWPAAEVMNYTLFLIGLFIIAAGLAVWKPRPTRLSPSSVRKAAVTSALIWPRPLTHSAPLLPWYLARVLFCLTSRISRRRCWIK
ncbi:fucose permease [Klebsiella pneumoniae]|uniref:Fucose permease n=1 Tax=Klebsiella pneumoniae TaxID=573 RepID=A0A377VYM1_KLEPN|nr:fucose permease [Klebsiella pneumoniae]